MTEASGRFTCEGTSIRDARGRTRIFHGANVSGRSKLPPFLPFEDPQFLDPLRDWGFNVIRLLVMWEGLEIERGVLDLSYLEKMCALATEAGKRGLYVIVDFHQDLYSRMLGGDGAPPWAVKVPGPATTGRKWFYAYFTSRSVRRSQRAFWRDEDGILSAFLTTVGRVMERMRHVPSVLGYDLWNEPMGNLRSVVTGGFEQRELARFHDRCVKLRNEHDPDRLLFFEPSPLTAFGVPSTLRRPRGERVVYAPHIYDGTSIVAGRHLPAASTFSVSLEKIIQATRTFDAPGFIGEFGVINGLAGARDMMEEQVTALDRHGLSWTVWHYNPSDIDWNDEDASIVAPGGGDRSWTDPLIRPFARAVSGETLRCEGSGSRWHFAYRADPREATEIVVPRRWGGSKAVLDLRGASSEWVDDDVLELRTDEAREVDLSITR